MKQREAELRDRQRPQTARQKKTEQVVKMEMLDQEFDEDGNLIERERPTETTQEVIHSARSQKHRGQPIYDALYNQSEVIKNKKEKKAANLKKNEEIKIKSAQS